MKKTVAVSVNSVSKGFDLRANEIRLNIAVTDTDTKH